MAGIAITRNPLFVSFDSKFRARLSKGANALIPKTWTRVLMIADPEEKRLPSLQNPRPTSPFIAGSVIRGYAFLLESLRLTFSAWIPRMLLVIDLLSQRPRRVAYRSRSI